MCMQHAMYVVDVNVYTMHRCLFSIIRMSRQWFNFGNEPNQQFRVFNYLSRSRFSNKFQIELLIECNHFLSVSNSIFHYYFPFADANRHTTIENVALTDEQ